MIKKISPEEKVLLDEEHKRLQENVAKVQNRLREMSENKESFQEIAGAYGDIPGCIAVVDKTVTPESGGKYATLLGCSYKFRGLPEIEFVNGGWFALAKAHISSMLRDIVGGSFTLQLSVVWLYLFRRRKFNNLFHWFVQNIYDGMVKENRILTDKEFNPAMREVRRAFTEVIKRKTGQPESIILGISPHVKSQYDFWIAILKLSKFVTLFIELDNAYRLRLQDIFGEVRKNEIEKDVIKEVSRLFDIAISRDHQIAKKWIFLKGVLIPFLRFNKEIREFVRDIFLEIDADKVAMDEDDWYFSLKRNGYDFGGMRFDERDREKRIIDKSLGHVSVFLEGIYDENGDLQSLTSKLFDAFLAI